MKHARPPFRVGVACRVAVAFAALAGVHAHAWSDEGLRIRAVHGDPRELAAVEALQRTLARHDVSRWIYTREIAIDRDAIPHSHPVLTLDLGAPRDERVQLASFLHEQFHWYLESRPEAVARAKADFRALYPDAPAGHPLGARDQQSTYLHLIVCDLELQAMAQLVGESEARRLLRKTRHYTWIYAHVLDDPRVREVNARHGLLLPGDPVPG